MDVPDFTDQVVDLITDQSDGQPGHLSIRELERLRDDTHVGVKHALRKSGSGADGTLLIHEARVPSRKHGQTTTTT